MRKFKIYSILTGIAIATVLSCTKPIEGFLSDNIFYRSNPFTAEQGGVFYSSPLEVDGSTAPLTVTVLDLRDKATGKSVLDSFSVPKEITTFKGEITPTDTSLALINAKLEKRLVKPFNVNPVGGRIELSAASRYMPAGTYEMDVAVKNVRGNRTLTKVCDIVLKEPTTSYEFIYKAWTTSTVVGEVFSAVPFSPDFRIKWNPTGENKIILKWVDKNGTPFNPKAGEVIKRGDRPTFANWDPYFPEEKTDTALVYRFPDTGLKFPLLNQISIAGGSVWNDGISYYRVTGAANDIGMNVNTVHTIKYLKNGTYEVTFHLSNVVHK
ncbi:MAG: hypothetical protein V4717_04830 [Bacteroidota bacterium]